MCPCTCSCRNSGAGGDARRHDTGRRTTHTVTDTLSLAHVSVTHVPDSHMPHPPCLLPQCSPSSHVSVSGTTHTGRSLRQRLVAVLQRPCGSYEFTHQASSTLCHPRASDHMVHRCHHPSGRRIASHMVSTLFNPRHAVARMDLICHRGVAKCPATIHSTNAVHPRSLIIIKAAGCHKPCTQQLPPSPTA